MMEGNPSWWSLISDKTQQSSAFLPPCPSLFPQFSPESSSLPLNSSADDHNQEFPESWSQLLMTGLASEEAYNKFGGCNSHFQHKGLGNWEDHHHHHHQEQQQQILINSSLLRVPVFDVKQEDAQSTSSWSQIVMPVSSPRSSVTTTTNTATTTSSSSSMLDFSNNKRDGRIQCTDHSSECNSAASRVGVSKKARVHSTSTQQPLKVRKEKLGERITALHQLVSPFGKTDTASVLLEAIGYIGFLQGQIEALCSPYLGNAPSAKTRHQQSVPGERNCTFQDDYAQGKDIDAPKDLRSTGLCLVPLACTQHVGSENGADYWAPS